MSARAPVLLVGAGPAGLAAAAALARVGVAFDWIDRHGTAGGAYHRMYPALTLASPIRHSSLPGLLLDEPGEYVTAGVYARYLARFAARLGRDPECGELSSLAQLDGQLRATIDGAAPPPYRAVVIATGMFDAPRPIEIPGLAASDQLRVLHARDWRGPAALGGGRLLVVGGGMSGVELAEEAARAGGPVTLSARHRVRAISSRLLGRELHDWSVLLERLPVPSWTRLCRGTPRLPAIDRGYRALVRDGRIALRPALVAMTGSRARFADGREDEFDAVVLATGYRHATPFLPAEVARRPGGLPVIRRGRAASWPALHFVGFPCTRGVASVYLRGVGADAARVAERLR